MAFTFGGPSKKELDAKIAMLENTVAELKEYAESLELEVARKDRQIAMMEKMMKLDQVRRGNK